MADRAKYLTLDLALYAVTVAVIVGVVAAIFQRAFLGSTSGRGHSAIRPPRRTRRN